MRRVACRGVAGLCLLSALLCVCAITTGRTAKAEDPCDPACDPTCAKCCQSWTLRATCSNGKGVATQGAYTTYREAKDAADSTNQRVQKCNAPGAGPCRDYARCGPDEVAVWAPYCAPELVRVSASEAAEATREIDALLAVCEAQISSVDDVSQKLAAFSSGGSLNARVKKKIDELIPKLANFKSVLTQMRDNAQQMRDARRTSAADARKLRGNQAKLLRDVMTAVNAGRRLCEEAAASPPSPSASPPAPPAPPTEAAPPKPTGGDAAAQAEAARNQAALDKETEETAKPLQEIGALAAGKTAELSTFLGRSDLSENGKNKGMAAARKLYGVGGKVAAVHEAAQSAKAKTPVTAALTAMAKVKGQARELLKDTKQVCDEVKALIETKSSYAKEKPATPQTPPPSGSGTAAPGPSVPPSGATERTIPTCEILFEPADNVPGIQISLDGGPAAELPVRLKIASGRHAILVKKGKLSEQLSELLLCGYVSRVPISTPK